MGEDHGSVDAESLGRFVREKRRARGWTQSELAKRNGWTQERISLIENGKYGLPALPALIRLAESLDVPPGDIFAALGLRIAPAVTEKLSNESASWSDVLDLFNSLSHWQMALVDHVEELHQHVSSMEEQMLHMDELRTQLRHSRAALGSLTEQLRADTTQPVR